MIHKFLTSLDRLIAERGGHTGFAVGVSLTHADLAIFANLKHIAEGHWNAPPDCLDAFAHIQAIRKTVACYATDTLNGADAFKAPASF